MCGIAGYIGLHPVEEVRIDRCLKLMGRRGPDACGVYQHSFKESRHVCLIHTRLSIIDLDKRSNQPFQVGSKVLVYNGEIYNYLELKQTLRRLDVPFETRSDTEVLLKVLDRYGEGGLDRCEGMWAFAFYDEGDGSLLLSRDRFAEKPLYYFQNETGLYFGSEPKFIFALLGRVPSVNMKHLYRFLVNGYKSLYKKGDTFFTGLKEVESGHVLRIDEHGRESHRRYWVSNNSPDEDMGFDEATEGVRERLIKSVDLRLRSDVPLAFCMSGGIDSNALISIAKRIFDYDVHGFTIVNTDERYEEQDLVDASVRELGIKHTAIPVNTADFLPQLRELIQYHDAPVYTISYYAHWLLMRSIAEHGYKVSISGTGADELFTGYYDHHCLYLNAVKDDEICFQESLANWNRYIKPIVRNPYLQDPLVFIKNPLERGHIYLGADVFCDYMTSEFSEEFTELDYNTELLRNRMLNELFHESVPVILHEDDLNAMYFSIENRSPFLDRDLFEFSQRVPTQHMVQDGKAKAVLRSAMRGIVSDSVLDSRRKVGFNAPIFSFLDVKDPDVRACLLDDSPIFDHVRKDRLESLLGRSTLPNSDSKFLFYFLNCKFFLENFDSC
ncbi:MAG: asparagine synthase (glutamine-hydrolyzing) [Deltaproteobacteria bacterium]|nr:asparagine synthase (glutamine-hydrolyzing) [Deltaproteobacteria bacterium]